MRHHPICEGCRPLSCHQCEPCNNGDLHSNSMHEPAYAVLTCIECRKPFKLRVDEVKLGHHYCQTCNKPKTPNGKLHALNKALADAMKVPLRDLKAGHWALDGVIIAARAVRDAATEGLIIEIEEERQ